MIDLQHQRVQQRQRDQLQVSTLSICENRGQWEDLDNQKRLNSQQTAPRPPDTHNVIQSNFRKGWRRQYIQNMSPKQETRNKKLIQHNWCLMPKLAYTQQISVFLLKCSTVFLVGSALDVLDFCKKKVSMRSTLPKIKFAGILFCVILAASGVAEPAWPSPQHRHSCRP